MSLKNYHKQTLILVEEASYAFKINILIVFLISSLDFFFLKGNLLSAYISSYFSDVSV